MRFFRQLLAEWRHQSRRPFVWFCFFAFFFIAFGDTAQTGWQGSGNDWVNGAAMIGNRGVIYSLLGIIAVAGIVTDPFVRDRSVKMQETLLTTPIGIVELGLARFVAVFTCVIFASVMFIPGMILGSQVPGIPPELVGPIVFQHYLQAFLYFMVPNYFLISTLVFCVSVRWENRSLAYAGGVAFLAIWVTVRMMLGRDVMRQEVFGFYSFADPFGTIASAEFVANQSVSQKNQFFLPFSGLLSQNRLLWIAVAFAFLAVGHFFVPVRPRSCRSVRYAWIQRFKELCFGLFPAKAKDRVIGLNHVKKVAPGEASSIFEMFWLLKWNLRLILKQPATYIGSFLVMMTLWWSASSAVTNQFSLPTTDLMVHNTGYYFDKILVLAVVWISGDLIWREKSLKLAEVVDSQPFSDFSRYVAATLTLVVVVCYFWLMSIAVNVLYQTSQGYYRYEFGLYLVDSFIFKAPFYLFFAVLSLTIQCIVRNRLVGISIVLLVFISEVFLDAIGLKHPMFHYGRVSHFWYSLMDGYGHFWNAHLWMLAYWSCWALFLWVIGWGCFFRGYGVGSAATTMGRRFSGGTGRIAISLSVILLGLVGSSLWYQSYFLGNWPLKNEDRIKAELEKKYSGRWRGKPQPKIIEIVGNLDFFPSRRQFSLRGSYKLENQSQQSLKKILIPSSPHLLVDEIQFDLGGKLIEKDEKLNVMVWELGKPLAPGETCEFQFQTQSRPNNGIAIHTSSDGVPEVHSVEVIGNGTSLLNLRMMPGIGYTDRVEHKPSWKRRKYGLSEDWRAPFGDDQLNHGHATVHLGWVQKFDMTISTDPGQTALCAGKLVKQWTGKNGRPFFRYIISGKTRGWTKVVTGRYQKRVFKNGLLPDVEVYYDVQHESSVDRIGKELSVAMKYYSDHYGKPPFEVFRIAEHSLHYPGFGCRGGFGSCSEITGWKSDQSASGGEDIRRMAAIMMGMSWWGDQIIPANQEGAKIIHSGLPYWTAALYLNKTRKTEVDRKIRYQQAMELFKNRGEMTDKEGPFLTEFKDSSMIRKKGTFLMLFLADLIGHKKLESVLADFLAEYRFKKRPYPAGQDVVTRIEKQLPEKYRFAISDIFEEITLWRLKVTEANCKKLKDGKWEFVAKVHAIKTKTTGWGDEEEVDFLTPVNLVAFSGNGFKKASITKKKREVLKSGINKIRWELDKKPTRFGADPWFFLPDPNPHDNVRAVVENK